MLNGLQALTFECLCTKEYHKNYFQHLYLNVFHVIFCVKHKRRCQMLEKLFGVFFHFIYIPCLAPKFHELTQSQKTLNGLLWCFCFCFIIWLLSLLSICLVWYEDTIWRIQMILIIRDSDNGFILVQTKREMKSGKVSDP